MESMDHLVLAEMHQQKATLLMVQGAAVDIMVEMQADPCRQAGAEAQDTLRRPFSLLLKDLQEFKKGTEKSS